MSRPTAGRVAVETDIDVGQAAPQPVMLFTSGAPCVHRTRVLTRPTDHCVRSAWGLPVIVPVRALPIALVRSLAA